MEGDAGKEGRGAHRAAPQGHSSFTDAFFILQVLTLFPVPPLCPDGGQSDESGRHPVPALTREDTGSRTYHEGEGSQRQNMGPESVPRPSERPTRGPGTPGTDCW